jgi:dTDP-4-amino-4,6-dideoxygalactose transaminase
MRQQVADRYADRLAHLAEIPQLASQATSSWAQYTIKLPAGCDRDIVMKTLADHHVPSAIYYPVPMHRHSPYSGYPVSADGLQITAALCGRVLALPMHPYLEAATQDHIAGALATAIAAGSTTAATG